ncbi:MAG: AAA-like domain-containing protein [Chloroflexota bacterium]
MSALDNLYMERRQRTFTTRGPVDAERHYIVPRRDNVADLVNRIKDGRYVVIFAPRQTGKTTLLRDALDTISEEEETYFPIQLDFQIFKNASIEVFYNGLKDRIYAEIRRQFECLDKTMSQEFTLFLEKYPLKDHYSFTPFLEELADHLDYRRVAIIIDEFDGIPQAALSDFLYTLREIYNTREPRRCPYSLGIVGVKSIHQLNYDRSISPFNVQDDFELKNFTIEQIRHLLGQYTEDVGQPFAPEVFEEIHRQTAGQPFLVNRLAQMLTEEMDIPLTEPITLTHFEAAHKKILREHNTNITHLTTNVRRDRRFESILMRIALRERPVDFNLDNEYISELATYGVLASDEEGNCQIQNPIYQYRIVRTFQPVINGLEDDFLPEDTDYGFYDYLTEEGTINVPHLLANFRDFIARAGYRILEIPEAPQEFVGQHLLFGYLDQFVRQVQGFMYLEVPSGRGRMDLIILHEKKRYIVETKLWEGKGLYKRGKQQLAAYLETEGETEGYYVVFDHRSKPEARQESETIDRKTIVSFVIPVVQKRPSDRQALS